MASHGKTSRLRIHDFRHRGDTYEVCLEELDGQRFTGVYGPNGIKRILVPYPEEIPTGLSPQAIRKGYIAVAEWLVKNDRRPDEETRAALLRTESLEAAA